MEILLLFKSIAAKYQLHNTAALFLISYILIRTDKKQALLHQQGFNDTTDNKREIKRVDIKVDKLENKVESNTKEIGSIQIFLAEKYKKPG